MAVSDGRCLAFAPQPPRVGHELPEPPHGDAIELQHDQRPAVVAASGEELVRLTFEQGLLLGLVTHEQDGNVGADDPPAAGLALRVGPDESATTHPKVEAFAV